MNVIKHQLTTGEGYVVLENLISTELIDSILAKQDKLYPVRASSSNKKYAERDEIQNLPNISVWWSQMLMDWPEVIEIENVIRPHIKTHMPNAEWYAGDIVVLEPHSTWINPHIDTPHRFKKYNYNKNLLGIQCIVALSNLDKDTGATGILPGSQNKDFNINLCYQGMYTNMFTDKCIQPELKKGSVLFYNSRLLHSSMPNPQKTKRPALLINYLDGNIIEDVKKIDNIWASNE